MRNDIHRSNTARSMILSGPVTVLDGLTLSGSTGGALYVDDSMRLTLSNSTLSGNSATRGGGLTLGSYAVATLQNVTVSGNTAILGGGVFTNQWQYLRYKQ